jgi:hypothetical protein
VRRCVVAFGGGGAGTVVADDAALVLHHGERGRKVRWGPRKARRGAASSSPSGRTAATMEESGRVPSLSVTVGGHEASSEGAVEERVQQSGMDEGDTVKKGNGGGRRLLWRPGGAGGEEKWQGGPGFSAHGWENGVERGGRQARQATARVAGIGWRAWAAPLPRDNGGRRGVSDAGASG